MSEVKLGFFVLTVLAVFLFFTVNMGSIFLNKGERAYQLYFDNIGTLDVGAPVKQAGYDVGEVTGISLQTIAEPTPATYIVVEVRVSDDAIISTDSKASLQTLGMMGEKYIEITFGKGPPATAGTRIEGRGPYELDRVMQNAVDLTNELMVTVQSINSIFGDSDFQTDITNLIANIEQFSENLNTLIGGEEDGVRKLIDNALAASAKLNTMLATAEIFVGDLRRISLKNESRIDETLENTAAITREFRQLSSKLDDSLGKANSAIAKIESLVDRGGPGLARTAENLSEITENAKEATARINEMIQREGGLVHDLFYDDDLSESAKSTVRKASGVIGAIASAPDRLSFNAEMLYFADDPRYDANDHNIRADLGLQYDFSDSLYIYLGGNNLGSTNDFEGQFGYRWNRLTFHGGVNESELAAGVDLQILDRWMVGLEGVGLTDNDEERLDAYSQVRLWDELYLIGGAQDITDEVFPNAGLRIRF